MSRLGPKWFNALLYGIDSITHNFDVYSSVVLGMNRVNMAQGKGIACLLDQEKREVHFCWGDKKYDSREKAK